MNKKTLYGCLVPSEGKLLFLLSHKCPFAAPNGTCDLMGESVAITEEAMKFIFGRIPNRTAYLSLDEGGTRRMHEIVPSHAFVTRLLV